MTTVKQKFKFYQHRARNLGIARNWIPPSDVMRSIKALVVSKLNHFHLLASDTQSWHMKVPSLTDLALKSAYKTSQK